MIRRNCPRCLQDFMTADHTARVCLNCRVESKRRVITRNDPMTRREQQLADLVTEGLINKEIADRLGLGEGTIKEYLNRIFHKTGCANRTELAIWNFIRQSKKAEETSKETHESGSD